MGTSACRWAVKSIDTISTERDSYSTCSLETSLFDHINILVWNSSGLVPDR